MAKNLMPRKTQSPQKWQHVHCVSRILHLRSAAAVESNRRRKRDHDTAVGALQQIANQVLWFLQVLKV